MRLPLGQKDGCSLHVNVPASWPSLDEFLGRFVRYCEGLMPAGQRFAIELLLREALANAILHGSGGDESRRIGCVVRMNARRFMAVVADDGPGFDWRARRNHMAEDTDCSGRGMEIYRHYATRIRFNARGNVVILRKTFKPSTERNGE